MGGSNMTLIELINTGAYPTDKANIHSYIPIYDMLFEKFKDEPINILEVGIQYGASIALWNSYFVNATIFGYDIEDTSYVFPDRAVKIIEDINNISSDEFKNNPLTIAIDDGSHTLEDQLAFISRVFPQIVEGGLLIIEDVQDIDNQKQYFDALNIPYSIIDLRCIKDRFDDVLLVFKKLKSEL